MEKKPKRERSRSRRKTPDKNIKTVKAGKRTGLPKKQNAGRAGWLAGDCRLPWLFFLHLFFLCDTEFW